MTLAVWLLGVGIGAATAAGLVALGYRWYVRERVPTGLGVLFGLTVVSVYVGATGALGAVISNSAAGEAILQTSEVLPNLAAFAVGAAGSSVGIRVGDAAGTDLFAATGGRNVDRDVSEIVQTVGRVTSVKLPDDVDDIVGYDPMPEETKETLAGRRFLFPRRLRKDELRERLVSRLKTDYGVGHVDLELTDDGEVTYLAIGSRAAGIGPTLPPATNAVAIRADPAHAASAGDLVQVWETDPLKRVLTGELRGVAGDVVTVAIDASDTPKLDPTSEYKLVTLPVQDRPDREFASLLRAAEETMGTVTVQPGSELVGTAIGDLGVTVAAITREGAPPEPIPSRGRVLDAGDIIYAIAKPEALRQVENTAKRQREVESAEAESEADSDPSTAVADTATPDVELVGDDDGAAGADPSGGQPPEESESGDGTGDDAPSDGTADDGSTESGAVDRNSAATDTEDDEPPVADTLDQSATAPEAPEADASTEPPSTAESAPDDTNHERTPDGTNHEDDGLTDSEDNSPTDGTDDTEQDATEESVTVWDPEERLDSDESPSGDGDDAADGGSGDTSDTTEDVAREADTAEVDDAAEADDDGDTEDPQK